MDAEKTRADGRPLVLLDRVTVKDKKKDRVILEVPHFRLDRGETVAITGPSGSGKSTFLKLLALMTNDKLEVEGTYLLEGEPVGDMDPTHLRREVSYCFQNPLLFGETVADNLAFPYEIRGLDFDRDHALDLLVQSGLSKEDLYKGVGQLSGGERQRVALIRNLLFLPKILLLDEITSSLDKENSQNIMAWLWDLRAKEDLTFLLVSHDPEDRAMADRSFPIPMRKEA
ncbi:MAG: ATP-binding cassette domain-containing protein [Firmicutes bacterium]|nr:ATP-binding cassette domain-containing protein [Bacillota bacterium]